MDSFAPRNAPLEYWFWTFHAGELAFLVDFIVRRGSNEAEIRISLWVGGEGRVEHQRSASWSTDPARVVIGDSRLRPDGSTGAVGDIAWDLAWSPGADLVDPARALTRRAHPLDMEFLLHPGARFRGSVRVGDTPYPVVDEPGSFTHYWGRRLSDAWLWISATRFDDDPGRRLEVLLGRSRLWGRIPLPMQTAYVWITDGARSELTISPLTGFVRQRRSDVGIEIDVRRWTGGRHRITCQVDAGLVNDLGNGIHQTLLANLTIDGHRAAAATVGAETRGGPL